VGNLHVNFTIVVYSPTNITFLLVRDQVAIIFVVYVCLSVCLCSFSEPSLIGFRSNLDIMLYDDESIFFRRHRTQFVTNPKNLPAIFLYCILITANMQSKTGFPSTAKVPPEIRGALSCQRMLAFLFLANVAICCCPYVCRLSIVCNVLALYRAG